MSKQLKEIRNFMKGITSNASPTDINDESATYSLNVNSNNILGRLEGIQLSDTLTANGFNPLESMTSSLITLNLSNVFSDYYGGESEALSLINSSTVRQGFHIDDLTVNNELPSGQHATINNATGFITAGTGDQYTIPPSANAYNFFDDNGTLQYLILGNAMWDGVGNILTIPGFDRRLTGATVGDGVNNTYQNKPVYGFNGVDDDNNSVLFHPSKCMFHIHLSGEEWIFKIKDTDDSAPNSSPYECNLSTIAPNSLLGVPYSSNSWNVNVVTVDVDLNFNRLYTDVSPVMIFLNQIKDTLEASGKATVAFSQNEYELLITPINTGLDYFNLAQPLSYAGSAGDSISIIQIIDNGAVNFNSVDLQALPDKDDKNKTDIINITESSIEYYPDIFSTNIGTGSAPLLDNFSYTSIDLQSDSNKIYIGAGGNIDSPPKIALKTKGNNLINSSESSTMKVENFNLDTYEDVSNLASGAIDIGDTVLFPLHGTEQNAAGNEILYGDDTQDEAVSYLDYDFVTADLLTTHLHTYISDNNIKIGQIIMLSAGAADSADEAFLQWKQYDYDASESATKINELYMYCGEAEHATPYPILRYIGVLSAVGGTNAFGYTYKEHSLLISKISLTTTKDSDGAFNGDICVGTSGSAGPGITPTGGGTQVQITNTGARNAVFDLRETISSLPNSTYISALSPCNSPLLYNSWNLPGAFKADTGEPLIDPFNAASSDIFRTNGNLKYIARHGIFWMSFENSSTSLYKVNFIDFHGLTEKGIMHDAMTLNFSNIPNRLCNSFNPTSPQFNDDNGIINVNIADQEFSANRHIQSHDVDEGIPLTGPNGEGTYLETENPPTDFESQWSNTPDSDTIIIGLCETFECGRIKMIQHQPSINGDTAGRKPREFLVSPCDTTIATNTGEAYFDGEIEVKSSPQYSARLTTGDKVRFIGLPTDDEENIKFNINKPVYEVNMVDTDKFIIDAEANSPGKFNGDYNLDTIVSNSNINNTAANNKAFWWNSKLWILYAKKNNQQFSRWQLFLYNTNTLDIETEIGTNKTLKMADRTPPYTEAGRYLNNAGGHFYYPRQFAFMMHHQFPNSHDSIAQYSYENTNRGANLNRENFMPNGFQVGAGVTDMSGKPFCAAFGIYDKSGRWTVNGGMQWIAQSTPYSHPVPGRSMSQDTDVNIGIETSYHHFGVTGFCTNGKLFWGHNIGWDDSEPRKVNPIKNSLHPLSHYSRSFLAGRVYKGSTGKNLETFNLPRHAVSFLGEVDGKFVTTPATIERHGSNLDSGRPFVDDNEDSQSMAETIFDQYGIGQIEDVSGYFYGPTLEYVIDGGPDWTIGNQAFEEEFGNNIGNVTDTYGPRELTLFQLDEWTGHPGIVYRNMYEGITPSQTDFGVVRGRPNFGGPEIENPNFKCWVQFGSNRQAENEEYMLNERAENINQAEYGDYATSNRHVLTNPANSRGFHTANPEQNIGWSGYKPPSLFSPGKGYYVFINRTWKTASQRSTLNGKNFNHHWGESEDFESIHQTSFGELTDTTSLPTSAWDPNGWNFQWYDWPADGIDKLYTLPTSIALDDTGEEAHDAGSNRGGRRLEKCANRWSNFSSTAVGDASFPTVTLDDASSDGWADGDAAWSRYDNYNKQVWTKQGQGAGWQCNKYISRQFVYDTDNPFHPLYIEDFGNIQYEISTATSATNMNEGVNSTFKTGRGEMMGPVSTMHKIHAPNFDKINSIFPVLVASKVSTTDANFEVGYGLTNFGLNHYVPMYMCSIKVDSTTSGILAITHDLTSKMVKDAKRFSEDEEAYYDYYTNHNESGLYVSYRTASCAGVNFNFATDNDSQLLYTSFTSRDTFALETIKLTHELTSIRKESNQDTNNLFLRGNSFQNYSNQIIGENISLFDAQTNIPSINTSTASEGQVSGTAAENRNFHLTVNSDDNRVKYYIYKENCFNLEGPEEDMYLAGNSTGSTSSYGDTSGYFVNSIIDTPTDGAIYSESITGIEIELGPESITGPINPGGDAGPLGVTYKYKFTLEYDDEVESSLQDFGAFTKEVTASDGSLEYLNVTIKLTNAYLHDLSSRVTGLGIYRTEDDLNAYALVDIVKLKADLWLYDTTLDLFKYTLRDKGTKFSFYEWQGISQDAEDVSKMHYGLSTIYKGYMFISDVYHPKLDNPSRYIFRSLPGNFFKYDWANEYTIMPEVPIAMTSFNSRLYVWGKNKLYKVDPITLLIEDEYEGISIAGPKAFVKTEFGLCFLDKNNIYLHDGNKPNPIANPILNSAAPPEDANGVLIQSGYRELVEQTIANGQEPNVFFLNSKMSFAVNLSNSEGKGRIFLYNILNQRWDLSESPKPVAVSSSSDGTVLISDGNFLYKFASSRDKTFSKYARREWTWHSKDLTFGADTQDKVFRGINITGTPSLYNEKISNGRLIGGDSDDSIKVYIDDKLVPLKIENKKYASTKLGDTQMNSAIYGSDTTFEIINNTTSNQKQEFIRPGHYIKINDEIMFVESVNTNTNITSLTVERGQLGTSKPYGHPSGDEIYIISPRLKISSNKKGKRIKIVADKQRGYIDSIGIIYKSKSIK